MKKSVEMADMGTLCKWVEQEWTGAWETGCGHAFVFTDGGPADNEFRFCPWCGRLLHEVPFVPQEEE